MYSGNEHAEWIERITNKALSAKTRLVGLEKKADIQREAALELLSRTIWHPSVIITQRRVFNMLERQMAEQERVRRELMSGLRSEDGPVAELERLRRSISHDDVPVVESDSELDSTVTLPLSS